jgi:hypothetical protein
VVAGGWDWSGRRSRHTSLTVVVVCLTLLLGFSGAFWAGRKVERGSQFGQALMYAPALKDLDAARASLDTMTMQYMVAMSRCRARFPR